MAALSELGDSIFSSSMDESSDNIDDFLRQDTLIFSDIDDTIICSKGKWPKGIDSSCGGEVLNDEMYPRVGEFLKNIGGNSIGILTARPEMLTGHLKEHFENSSEFSNNGLTIGPILSGCITRSLVRGFSNYSLGMCKYIRLNDFIRAHRVINRKWKRIIFVGDNGQGDEYAATLLLQNNEIYRHIQKIYIHRVRNKASPFQAGLLDISNNDGKVEYFDNYGELIDTMSVAKGRKRSRRRKKRTQRRRRRRKNKERESRRKSRSKPNKSN